MVAIFGKGRLILQVLVGSIFLGTINLTSWVLSRIEQNCFFFYARKRITKSQISDLNEDFKSFLHKFLLLNKFGHNIKF